MEKVSKEMYDYINEQLNKIEKENNIEILYCIESGSRGYGFSNEDSDYDVRFIFKRSVEDYLTINSEKDTIDYFDGNLDYVGWDIKKALFLHRKSNPNLREWTKQKIVYRGDCEFLNDLPPFNPVILKYHYRSLAYNDWKKYVKNEEMTKRVVKTYIYAIRCILTWIKLDDGEDAPVQIDELMKCFACDDRIGTQLYEDMTMLISHYRSNCKENEVDERGIENIRTFIEEYLEIMAENNPKVDKQPDIEIYNNKFREIVLK